MKEQPDICGSECFPVFFFMRKDALFVQGQGA